MTWSTPLSAALVETFLASTVLLVVALVLRAFLRHAALRVALAWGTFLGLAVLAVSPWVNVGPRLGVSEWFEPSATALPSEPFPLPEVTADPVRPQLSDPFLEGVERRSSPLVDRPAVSTTMPLPAPPAVEVPPVERRLSTEELALSGWTAGAGLAVLWILFGGVRAVRLLRRSREAPAWVLDEIRTLSRSSTPKDASRGFAPLQPRPPVRLTSDLSAAVAVGAVRPKILLPAESVREENRLAVRAALAHEAAHIRHGDLWLLALERLLLPVYFAHPLFWWLRRQVRVDQELLADAAAAGEAPVEYAEALVAWARTAVRPALPFGLAAMSLWDVRTPLTRRVEMLLAANAAHRRKPSRLRLALSTLLVLVLVLGLSRLTLEPVAAQEPEERTAPAARPATSNAALPEDAEPPAEVTAASAARELVTQLHSVDHARLRALDTELGAVIQDVAEGGCQLEDEVIVSVLAENRLQILQRWMVTGEWSPKGTSWKTALTMTADPPVVESSLLENPPKEFVSQAARLRRGGKPDADPIATVVLREQADKPDTVTLEVRLLKGFVRKPNKTAITVEVPRGSSLVLAELGAKKTSEPSPTPLVILTPPFRAKPSQVEAGKSYSFDFRAAPWKEVLELFCKQEGLALELTHVPPGTFTYADGKKYTFAEALDVLNRSLLQKDHYAVRRDKHLLLLSVDGTIDKELIPEVTLSELGNRGAAELVTIIVTLRGISPIEAVDEVKPQLGRLGRVVPLAKSNRIMITDLGGNLRQIVNNLKDVHHIADETPGFDTTGADARIRQYEQAFRAQTEAGSQAKPMDTAPAANADEELRALELTVAEEKVTVAGERLEFVKRLLTKGYATAAQVTAAQVELQTAQLELLKLQNASAARKGPAPAPAAVPADKTSIEEKLLELDVREAELELESVEAAHKATKAAGNAVTQLDQKESELRVSKAQIAVERAKLKLESFRLENPRPAAAPKPAATEAVPSGQPATRSRPTMSTSGFTGALGGRGRTFSRFGDRISPDDSSRMVVQIYQNLLGRLPTGDEDRRRFPAAPDYTNLVDEIVSTPEYLAHRAKLREKLGPLGSQLQRTWGRTSLNGTPAGDSLLKIDIPLATIASPAGRSPTRYLVHFDESKTPAHLDLQRIDALSEVSRGLVKIEGDTLTLCLGRSNAPRPSGFRTGDDGDYPLLMTFIPSEDTVTVSGKIESLTERQLTLISEVDAVEEGVAGTRSGHLFAIGPETRFVRTIDGKETTVSIDDIRDDDHAAVELQFPFDGPVLKVRLSKQPASASAAPVRATEVDVSQRHGKAVVEVFGSTQSDGTTPPQRLQRLGVVVDPRGYIVAPGYVADLKDLRVTLDRFTSLPAKTLAHDDRTSLALLKVDAPGPLAHATWGKAAAVSQDVSGVFSQTHSVTCRVLAVNAQAADGDPVRKGLMQVGLRLEEHQLGLPLFDEDSLVGVTTISRQTDGATMTYAQPADAVRKFVEQALNKDGQM